MRVLGILARKFALIFDFLRRTITLVSLLQLRMRHIYYIAAPTFHYFFAL